MRICQDRSRSVSETYRPLALARLYGESWIFMVNFVSAVKEDFLGFLENREAVEPLKRKNPSLIGSWIFRMRWKYHL